VGCLVWLISAPLLAGCQGAFGTGRLPDDPLFSGRDPVESKAQFGPPTAGVCAAPSPPVNRVVAKNASAHDAHIVPCPRSVPRTLTSRSTPPERDIEMDDN